VTSPGLTLIPAPGHQGRIRDLPDSGDVTGRCMVHGRSLKSQGFSVMPGHESAPMPSFGQIREAQTLRASALIWPTNLRHASGENRNVTSARFLVSRTSTRLPARRSTFDGYAGTRSRSSGCAYVCHPRVPSPTAMMAVVAHE